jgi:hypothetical protein
MRACLWALDFVGEVTRDAEALIARWFDQEPWLVFLFEDLSRARQVHLILAGEPTQAFHHQACGLLQRSLTVLGIKSSVDLSPDARCCSLNRQALVHRLQSVSWVEGPFHLVNANYAGMREQVVESDCATQVPGLFLHTIKVVEAKGCVRLLVDGGWCELRVPRIRVRRCNSEHYHRLGVALQQAVNKPRHEHPLAVG